MSIDIVYISGSFDLSLGATSFTSSKMCFIIIVKSTKIVISTKPADNAGRCV